MKGPRLLLRLLAFDEAALNPYCWIIRPPGHVGQRAHCTEYLAEPHPDTSLRLHTNLVSESKLPFKVTQVERHPRTAQIFIPLDVARYVAIVAPADSAGRPVLDAALGMIVPGNRGIVFRQGTWHAAATVLDRAGSFFVLQYRGDTPADDDVVTLRAPLDVHD